MNENLEEIGIIADKLDGIIAMLSVPGVPIHVHLSCIRELLPEYSERLKKAVIAEGLENDWGE